MNGEAVRTPAEIAAEALRYDLLREDRDHGCGVKSWNGYSMNLSGHVDMLALSRAALSALEKEGWVLVRMTPGQRAACWTCEKDDVAGDLYYFSVKERRPPPYLHQRHVEAIVDIADDGTLAGVELIDRMPPPPHQGGKP